MKSIVLTYPNFRALPKGLKMALVASETLFFGDAGSGAEARRQGNLMARTGLGQRSGLAGAIRRGAASSLELN